MLCFLRTIALSLANTLLLVMLACALMVAKTRTTENNADEGEASQLREEMQLQQLQLDALVQQLSEVQASLERAEARLETLVGRGGGGGGNSNNSNSSNSNSSGATATWRGKRDVTSSPLPPAPPPSPPQSLLLANLRDSFLTSSSGKVSHWLDVGSGGGDDSSFRLKSPRDYDLVDRGTAIRVARGGLYLVYAQLWFDSRPGSFHRFEIRARRAPGLNPRTLAACAVVAPGGEEEEEPGGSFDQSCFTSVATVLRAGDLIHVHTGERGARLDAREGRSFFGIVRMDA